MNKPHRISAGGITFKDDTVLLVRYRDANGGPYLVAPGGGLKEHENVVEAIVRETMEETNVTVQPQRVVIIEDMITSRHKMIKVWMICDFVRGTVCPTEGAKEEGIIEAGWFTKAQLADEIVFPTPFGACDWNHLRSESWQVECMPSQKAGF